MSFKELLIKEYEDRSVELEKQIDEYNLLLEKKKNEFKDIVNEVNTKSSEIESKKLEIDNHNNVIVKLKDELTNLKNPSEPLYVIAFPDNSVTIAKKSDLQEVNNIELKEFNKLIDGIERNKAVTKLTKTEYKELLKSEDYSGIPLDDKYYHSPKKGEFWAQMHIRGILPEEYENYKSKKIPLWKAIRNHSMHVDLRNKFEDMKSLLQFVIVESDIESYMNVMEGKKDLKTNKTATGLVIIKPSAMEPSERIKEKKDMLLDEAGAKKVVDLSIESKSYWISPNNIGATKDKYAYMSTICVGNVKSGTMRSDFKEIFFVPDKNIPDKNQNLFNGRWIFKALKVPNPLWWAFKATKTETPCNPHCEIDSGNFELKPADKLSQLKKEDYNEWQNRKDEC